MPAVAQILPEMVEKLTTDAIVRLRMALANCIKLADLALVESGDRAP